MLLENLLDSIIPNWKLSFLVFLLLFSSYSVDILAKENMLDSTSLQKKLPKEIEIVSDTTVIIYDKNEAIFSGNVIAKHGDTQINTDEMKIIYASRQGGSKEGKKYNEDILSIPKIKKIQFIGNVFIKTSKEQASSRNGEYDLANATLVLWGDVLLKKDSNILVGDRLVYDKKTGRGLMMVDKNIAKKSKKRVRAILNTQAVKN